MKITSSIGGANHFFPEREKEMKICCWTLLLRYFPLINQHLLRGEGVRKKNPEMIGGASKK